MLANHPSVLTGGGVSTNLVGGTGLFANGTAAAPSLSYTSEPTTGLFKHSVAGWVGLSSQGSVAMYFSGGGTITGPNGSNYLQLGPTGYISLIASGTNQNITLTPSGTGSVSFGITTDNYVTIVGGQGYTTFGYVLATGHRAVIGGDGTGTAYVGAFSNSPFVIRTNNLEKARFTTGGLFLVGTGTDSSNGIIQLATHTTSAGGIGFGTDTVLYRAAAGVLKTDTIIAYGVYTVATLPAAAAGNTYGIVFVSDATNAAGTGIGTAPTGGGAVKRAVYSTGAAWLLL